MIIKKESAVAICGNGQRIQIGVACGGGSQSHLDVHSLSSCPNVRPSGGSG